MNLFLDLLLICIILIQLLRWFLAERYLRMQNVPSSNEVTSKKVLVSILQPILSGDPLLESCLESNLKSASNCQREWVWLIDTTDSVAKKICQRLSHCYPAEKISVILCQPAAPNHNPKTHKLVIGSQKAKGTYLAVLDDDTVLPSWALDHSLRYFEKSSCGLVFGVPYYRYHGTFWSALTAGFVNANSLLTYLPYLTLSPPLTINGMYYLMRTATIKKLDFFKPLRNQVCDDVAVAKAVRDIGLTLQQSTVLHPVSTHLPSALTFHRLMLRWFTFPRISLLPFFTLTELGIFFFFTMAPVFFGIATLWVLFVSLTTLPLVLTYWLVLLCIYTRISRTYLKSKVPIWWMLLSQLIIPWYVIFSFFQKPHIIWRGKKIHFNGNLIKDDL